MVRAVPQLPEPRSRRPAQESSPLAPDLWMPEPSVSELWTSRPCDAAAVNVGVHAGAPCWPARLPRALVAVMSRSLDFYLDLGCEVRSAADGWAVINDGAHSLVLIQGAAAPWMRTTLQAVGSILIVLDNPDVRALRQRLIAQNIPVSTIAQPDRSPAGEVEVIDPDRNRVAVRQPR